ncbi:hypothetical protein ZEAMMB73_Zm00001d030909 [Zea mays]|uniref:Uncharacterized protein n=1 Tax=Zea mays TaxID=4577 RepID=A0A1D6KEZ0_MAIZE|nr:hypothetical protein ZEAMMB73_Zm00001d030909 [Zea mays]
MRNASEHDGVGRDGDGPRRVHLDRLQGGDVPRRVGGQRPAVQQHDLARQVAILGGEVVLVSHGARRRLAEQQADEEDEEDEVEVVENATACRRPPPLKRPCTLLAAKKQGAFSQPLESRTRTSKEQPLPLPPPPPRVKTTRSSSCSSCALAKSPHPDPRSSSSASAFLATSTSHVAPLGDFRLSVSGRINSRNLLRRKGYDLPNNDHCGPFFWKCWLSLLGKFGDNEIRLSSENLFRLSIPGGPEASDDQI